MSKEIIIIILCVIMLFIPLIIFTVFNKERKIDFTQWIGLTWLELFFSMTCFLLIFLFYTSFTHYILIYILSLSVLIIYKQQIMNPKIEIKDKKSFMYAFIVIFLVYMAIDLYFDYFNLHYKYIYFLNIEFKLHKILLTLTIWGGYIFKVRVKDFNWGVTLKTIIVLIFIYILVEISPFILYDVEYLKAITLSEYMRSFLRHLYYPSIVEEFIFRGYLLSGLLAFRLREDKANIIQAIIFGLIHLGNYSEITLNTFFYPTVQVYMGYLIGRIYLNTKSLTPCILLHALIDTL